eukprot:5790931-Pyramimonas_sp.AAC.1
MKAEIGPPHVPDQTRGEHTLVVHLLHHRKHADKLLHLRSPGQHLARQELSQQLHPHLLASQHWIRIRSNRIVLHPVHLEVVLDHGFQRAGQVRPGRRGSSAQVHGLGVARWDRHVLDHERAKVASTKSAPLDPSRSRRIETARISRQAGKSRLAIGEPPPGPPTPPQTPRPRSHSPLAFEEPLQLVDARPDNDPRVIATIAFAERFTLFKVRSSSSSDPCPKHTGRKPGDLGTPPKGSRARARAMTKAGRHTKNGSRPTPPMMKLTVVSSSTYNAKALGLNAEDHEERSAQKLAIELEELGEQRSAPSWDFPLLTCRR